MRTCRHIILMTTVLLGAALSAEAATPPEQKIVDRWLRGKSLKGLTVGVSVVDAQSGTVLASHQAARKMNPASGTKLLTTAAALHLLPMTPGWETRVHGVVSGERAVGALRLVGEGDPRLLIAHLERLADGVADSGVTHVDGGLVVHAGRFDTEGLPPAYDQKQTDAGYRPSVGAVAANFGAVRVVVRPGKRVGKPAVVTVEGGEQAVTLSTEVRTVKGAGRSLTFDAVTGADGRTTIVVKGRIGIKAKAYDLRKRLHDPDLWTGDVLKALLARRGITIGGEVTVTTDPLPTDSGASLASITSRTLPELLLDVNTWSNNFMAETVFKQMGCEPAVPCSWKLATERVTEVLRTRVGLPEESFEVVNGSGLYRATMISAAAMTQLLVHMAGDQRRAGAFLGSLAVSGRAGTLKRRLTSKWTRGKVKGKTGTLDEVVSLSGYVPYRGSTLAFSVLVNGATPERTGAIRRKIDRLVLSLAKR